MIFKLFLNSKDNLLTLQMPTQTRSRSRSDVGKKESKRSYRRRYSDEESSSERRDRKSSRRVRDNSDEKSKSEF